MLFTSELHLQNMRNIHSWSSIKKYNKYMGVTFMNINDQNTIHIILQPPLSSSHLLITYKFNCFTKKLNFFWRLGQISVIGNFNLSLSHIKLKNQLYCNNSWKGILWHYNLQRLQHYVGPRLIIYFSWHYNDQTLKLLHIWYIDILPSIMSKTYT
jgi:hypothetical protein